MNRPNNDPPPDASPAPLEYETPHRQGGEGAFAFLWRMVGSFFLFLLVSIVWLQIDRMQIVTLPPVTPREIALALAVDLFLLWGALSAFRTARQQPPR